jgi:hypothetical protein
MHKTENLKKNINKAMQLVATKNPTVTASEWVVLVLV